MKEKKCGRCQKIKSLDGFSTDKNGALGRDGFCRECRVRGVSPANRVDPPEFRECRTCGVTKPIAKFRKTNRRNDGRETICAFCRAPHRNKNSRAYIVGKAKTAKRNMDVREKVKTELITKLGGKCCHCGLSPGSEWPLSCFDFHHDGKKNFLVAKILTKTKMRDILDMEIAGCLVLCANCHRRHHWRRKRCLLSVEIATT